MLQTVLIRLIMLLVMTWPMVLISGTLSAGITLLACGKTVPACVALGLSVLSMIAGYRWFSDL